MEENVSPQILPERSGIGSGRITANDGLARLSIHQTTTQRWSLPEAVSGYEQSGVCGIGVNLQKLEALGRDEALRLLNRSPLRVTSLGWIGGFTGDHDQTFQAAVEEATETIQLAAAIRAEAVHVLSGTIGGHIRSHATRLLTAGLRELVGVAKQFNVRLALQPMHRIFEREWSFLNGVQETLQILSQFSATHVGLAFGTYHFWDEDRLIPRLKDVTPWISSVQLSDWRHPPRCDNDRLLPGDGVIPLFEIVQELERCGYRGCYEIEVWSRDLWNREPHGLIRTALDRYRTLPVTVSR